MNEENIFKSQNIRIKNSMNLFNISKDLFNSSKNYIEGYLEITKDYNKKLLDFHQKSINSFNIDNTIKNENIDKDFYTFEKLVKQIPKLIKTKIEETTNFILRVQSNMDTYDVLNTNVKTIKSKIEKYNICKEKFIKKFSQFDKLNNELINFIKLSETAVREYYTYKKEKKKYLEVMTKTLTEAKEKETHFKEFEKSINNDENELNTAFLELDDLIKNYSQENINLIKKSNYNFILQIKNESQILLSLIKGFLDELIIEKDDDNFNFTELFDDEILMKNIKINIPNKVYKPKCLKEKLIEDGLSCKKTKAMSDAFTECFGMEGIQDEHIYLTEEIVFKIISKLYKEFEFVDKKGYNLEIEEIKLNTKELTNKLLYYGLCNLKDFKNLKPISDDELKILFERMHDTNYIIAFLQRLNNFRANGSYVMPHKEFQIISDIFVIIVDSIEKETDFRAAKFIVILSQTFYEEKDNNTKYYLSNAVRGRGILLSVNFWNKFIESSIQDEVEKIKQNDIINEKVLTKEEEEKRLSNVAFAQMVPISDNMLDFGLDLKSLNEVIDPLMIKYQIDEACKNIIMDVINNKLKKQ